MALIIEDGSGVVGATSYVTVDEVRAYCTARALSISTTDAVVETLIIKAMDLVESYRDKFKGRKKHPGQGFLQWPRYLVWLDTDYQNLPDTSIPVELKNAVCQLAYEASLVDLQPTSSGREKIRTKVDVLEVEYAATGTANNSPILRKAMTLLTPVLNLSIKGLPTYRL